MKELPELDFSNDYDEIEYVEIIVEENDIRLVTNEKGQISAKTLVLLIGISFLLLQLVGRQ